MIPILILQLCKRFMAQASGWVGRCWRHLAERTVAGRHGCREEQAWTSRHCRFSRSTTFMIRPGGAASAVRKARVRAKIREARGLPQTRMKARIISISSHEAFSRESRRAA